MGIMADDCEDVWLAQLAVAQHASMSVRGSPVWIVFLR